MTTYTAILGNTFAASFSTTNTTGGGFLYLTNQSIQPTTPSSGISLYANSSNIIFIQPDGFTRTLVMPAGGNVSYTIPNVGNSSFVMTVGDSTIAGILLATNISGTNTGDVTLASIGSVPNASGVSLVGQILTLQPANGSFGGLVTTSTQIFAGNKTFTGTIAASNFSGTSSGTNTGDVTLAAVGSTGNSQGASLTGQVLTLQPADSTNPGLLSNTTQSIAGNKTFIGSISASNLSGTNSGDVVLTVIGSSPNASAGSLIGQMLTLQPANGSFGGIVTTGVQTLAGNKTFTGTIAASNLSGTNTGDVTLAAIGASPNASAASLSGQVLNLQPADGSNPGVISTGTQTLAGNKTFTGSISASNFSGTSSGTNTGDVTLSAVGAVPNSNAASLVGQVLNLQPADGSNPGVVSTGTQTLAGNKTFTGIIAASNFSGTSSGTNIGDVTLSAVGAVPNSNAASLSGQVLNLQPADGSNPGVVSTGTQTLAGNKTFTGTIAASNLSGTNTGDVTLASIGAVPNASGASLSGQILTLEPASASFGGLVTTGSQTFGGTKTFSIVDLASGGLITQLGSQLIQENGGNTTLAVGHNVLPGVMGGNNTAVGNNILNTASILHDNTAIGVTIMIGNTASNNNIGIGSSCLTNLVSGAGGNVSCGNFSLTNLMTGGGNVAYGRSAGINYSGSESNNTLIDSGGSVGESQAIRIRDKLNVNSGVATSCFVGGIATFSIPGGDGPLFVQIDPTNDQLGAIALTITGTNTGDVTLAAIGAVPNANAASLSGQVLNLQPANASFGGVVTTTTQTYAGDKTFNGNIIGQLNLSLPTTTSTAGNININSIRFLHGFGTNNTFVGSGAGNYTLSSTNNIAVGQAAGSNLSTGGGNCYIGNTGIAAEANVTRIGTSQTQAFVSGVSGQTITDANLPQILVVDPTTSAIQGGLTFAYRSYTISTSVTITPGTINNGANATVRGVGVTVAGNAFPMNIIVQKMGMIVHIDIPFFNITAITGAATAILIGSFSVALPSQTVGFINPMPILTGGNPNAGTLTLVAANNQIQLRRVTAVNFTVTCGISSDGVLTYFATV